MIRYDRLPTEQRNPRSRFLDSLPVEKVLDLMNRENAEIPRAIACERKNISHAVSTIVRSMKSGGRIFFVGAGTSGRMGVLEAAELPPTFNIPPNLAQAFMAGGKSAVFKSREGAEDNAAEAKRIVHRKVRRGDVVIGIAASGVTPFVQSALKESRKIKAETIFVTCNPQPDLRKLARTVIALRVGSEIITGSTRLKSGTATKMVLNMLTTASMVRLGKVYGNLMVDLQPTNKKLRERGVRLVSQLARLNHPQALKVLVQAKWSVKTAVLMARKNLSYGQAVQELKRHGGFLGECLA